MEVAGEEMEVRATSEGLALITRPLRTTMQVEVQAIVGVRSTALTTVQELVIRRCPYREDLVRERRQTSGLQLTLRFRTLIVAVTLTQLPREVASTARTLQQFSAVTIVAAIVAASGVVQDLRRRVCRLHLLVPRAH